jgi:hypothetical protein
MGEREVHGEEDTPRRRYPEAGDGEDSPKTRGTARFWNMGAKFSAISYLINIWGVNRMLINRLFSMTNKLFLAWVEIGIRHALIIMESCPWHRLGLRSALRDPQDEA